MTLHKVRVTQEPDVDREVDDAELLDLKRLGLLVKGDKTQPAVDPVTVDPAGPRDAGTDPAATKKTQPATAQPAGQSKEK